MTRFSDSLLEWYDHHKRDLPWRTNTPNPYHVWLSEIMLQQTTVKTVIPYFLNFIHLWPKLSDLAAADLDDVLVAWQGLGYYSRARNLHKCALLLMREYGGKFPSNEQQLLTLPGIGPYTAAAIASIAFDEPAAAVDGNVIRVLSRFYAIEEARPKLDSTVKEKLLPLVPSQRCGDFTQAMMELGAVVCRPKVFDCSHCPLSRQCKGKVSPLSYPVPKVKKELPTRYAVAYLVQRDDGAIILRRRDENGMLGGMMEVPTTPWLDQKPGENVINAHRPAECEDWVSLPGFVKHTFSHFHFHIFVVRAVSKDIVCPSSCWFSLDALDQQALPTVMKKIIQHGLSEINQ